MLKCQNVSESRGCRNEYIGNITTAVIVKHFIINIVILCTQNQTPFY